MATAGVGRNIALQIINNPVSLAKFAVKMVELAKENPDAKALLSLLVDGMAKQNREGKRSQTRWN